MTTTASNIINDTSPIGTQILEATVTGDGTSAVSVKNDGTFKLGNSVHHGSISSDNVQFRTDGSGNVTAQNVTAGGTLNVTGNTVLSPSGVNSIGGKTPRTFSIFTGTVTTSGTFSHGLSSVPSAIHLMWTSGNTIGIESITNITSTQCTIISGSSSAQNFTAIAIG